MDTLTLGYQGSFFQLCTHLHLALLCLQGSQRHCWSCCEIGTQGPHAVAMVCYGHAHGRGRCLELHARRQREAKREGRGRTDVACYGHTRDCGRCLKLHARRQRKAEREGKGRTDVGCYGHTHDRGRHLKLT